MMLELVLGLLYMATCLGTAWVVGDDLDRPMSASSELSAYVGLMSCVLLVTIWPVYWALRASEVLMLPPPGESP